MAGLWSCGPAAKEETPSEYQGVGLHQSNPQATQVSGTLKYKHFSGGEIRIEARRSVPCAYGRCPVIGEPSLAEDVLQAPGAYRLELPESAKDLIVIATLRAPDGGLRIAHATLASEAVELSGIDLSLDRPYPPLR